jgi:glycosyltransferase involved in cell wall biosynthesis
VDTDIHSSTCDQGSYFNTVLHRFAFNCRLSPKWFQDTDLVLAFDFDGFALAGRLPCPFLQVNGGVLADIIRFEHGLPRILLRGQARLEGRAARRAAGVITPSRYAAEVVRSFYCVPSSRIHVVPFGIDLQHWSPPMTARPLEERPPVILCVARLYPRKNVLCLLRAFTQVAQAIPEARLEIAGDGLQWSSIRSEISRHPACERILLRGQVPRRQLPGLYHGAKVFCLPSRHETFGFVFLEAMAAGLPVVALQRTAVPEMVLDGRTGLLAGEDSPEELASLLIRVLRETGLARQLGEKGRQRAETFGWNRTGPLWREVIEDYCR